MATLPGPPPVFPPPSMWFPALSPGLHLPLGAVSEEILIWALLKQILTLLFTDDRGEKQPAVYGTALLKTTEVLGFMHRQPGPLGAQ